MRYVILILTLFFILSLPAPVRSQSALGAGFYDQTVPMIIFGGGSWSLLADVNHYGGTIRLASDSGSTIKFFVYGDGFIFYHPKGSNGGSGTLSVNGVVFLSNMSWFSATTQYGQTVLVSGLGWGDDGIHEVIITKTSSSATFVSMDALYVAPHVQFPTPVIPTYPPINVTLIMPTAVPSPTGTQFVYVGNFPEETLEPNAEQITLAGQDSLILYEIRPTDIVIVVMLGFVIIIMGAGFVVKVWGAK
jgi:hypothetical protein